ncbi:hypothetical protein Tco_0976621 [Tanacetum coccineum]|uniref:Uncharacterized protein n=1 Tax=Tanacetum coccineum TaxID=301880 RepID=A0ABQ5EHQ5_9ASTR
MEDTLNDMLSNQFRNAEENPNEPPRYLYNKDLFFLKNRNTKEKKYVLSLHKIHAVAFPEAGLEEMMNRWVRKEITEVVRITTDQQYGLDFMEQRIMMREDDKPDSFLNMTSSIESYQIKVNLIAPTLTFPGIEAHDPYSIVDKPNTVIMEYLVNISKRRAFWSLNEDILKITILMTNTPYPSRKIWRIRACTHQRPQRNKAQYTVFGADSVVEGSTRGQYPTWVSLAVMFKGVSVSLGVRLMRNCCFVIVGRDAWLEGVSGFGMGKVVLSTFKELKMLGFFLKMGFTLILATLDGLDVGLLGDVIGEDDCDEDE